MLQNATPSGSQRPDLLTSLMNMSLVARLPRKCIFADPLQMPHACHRFWKCYKTSTFCSLLARSNIPCACHTKRHLNVQKWSEHVVFLTFWLRNVLRATTACTFSTSQRRKVLRTRQFFYTFDFEMCFAPQRHALFDIATSKSGPKLVCFVHFDFETCFAPQRRALFSTSQLLKVIRSWRVLYILTWKCASRHNGVQFFISHLASWLRTRRFSEPTFQPSGATNHRKNMVFRDFPTFSRTWIFFLLRLSLSSSLSFTLTLPIPAFHLSILLEVWLLNFLRIWHMALPLSLSFFCL